jgi:hypothetical protein
MATKALADESWQPCSQHEVILSFLRSEGERWPAVSAGWDRRLIQKADLNNHAENHDRLKMLQTIRKSLMREVPYDTRWHKVAHLRDGHFHELRAIYHVAWTSPDDKNELEKVAMRRPQQWHGTKRDWEPILWAHDTSGPFTILEGNHRMTALATMNQSVQLIAYVGLSSRRCLWHALDSAT